MTHVEPKLQLIIQFFSHLPFAETTNYSRKKRNVLEDGQHNDQMTVRVRETVKKERIDAWTPEIPKPQRLQSLVKRAQHVEMKRSAHPDRMQ